MPGAPAAYRKAKAFISQIKVDTELDISADTEPGSSAMLTSLPSELQVRILEHLDYADLHRLR